MAYCTAALVASASIRVLATDTVVEVKKGDTLTNVTLAGRPDEVIASATVKGFIAGDRRVARGENTIYDGIPTRLHDEEGDEHFGYVDEVLEIRSIVVEIAPAEKDGDPTTKIIKVADVKALTVTPVVTDQTGTDDKGETGKTEGDSTVTE